MKKITKYITLLGLIFGLFSCVVLPNLKKDFNTYRLPVVQDEKEIPIKIDGVYAPKKEKGIPFFFFENGSIQWGAWVNNFWQNPIKGMEDIRFYEVYSSKEDWGHYTIQFDTILIQVFNRNNQEIFKRWVFEFRGVIQNDTSFLLLSWYSYWGKDQLLDEPVQYSFYKTKIKPDSSKAWFNKKKWFKKNLHESRKSKK